MSRYLLDFLRLVDARRFTLGARDPHTRQLAAFVPAHQDQRQDGLPVMNYPSRGSVINAIALGATDAQKPVIIAALEQEPELATVLLARGWTDDARTEILHLTQYPRRLPLPAIQAIVLFHDPKTYPRQLEECDANPDSGVVDALRTLPELQSSLDEIISRHWQQDRLVLSEVNLWTMFGSSFQLAMGDGRKSALQRAYLIMADPDFDDGNLDYYLANAFRQHVWMPDLAASKRKHDQEVIAWMRKHRLEDFTFNPELRQFIPKTTSSGEQVLNQRHP